MTSVSSNCCFALPERVELRSRFLDDPPPVFSRIRKLEREELTFVDQYLLPRIFAEMVALLALFDATGNLMLSATYLASLPLFLLFSNLSTCFAIFEQAMQHIVHAYEDAAVGMGIVYGLFYPERVVGGITSPPQPEEIPEEMPKGMPKEMMEETRVQEGEELIMPAFHRDELVESLPNEKEDPCENISILVIHQENKEKLMIFQDAPSLPSAPLVEAVLTLPPRALAVQAPLVVALGETPALAVAPDYAELRITREGADSIGRMIKKLSTTSLLALAVPSNREQLKSLGAEIENHDIHALKFLECILGNPELRRHLRDIRGSHFKWNGFLWAEGAKGGKQGTGGSLNRLAESGTLDTLLPGFCAALHADLKTVRALAQKRDWDKMLYYLMNLSN